MKNQKGITMIALTIMIILLIILASVSVTGGTKVIKEAQLESIETEMLTLKAKAKGFAEDIDSKTWNIQGDEERENKKAELFSSLYGMSVVGDTDVYNLSVSDPVFYAITNQTLSEMGLSEIDPTRYVIVFSSSDYTNMDVVLIEGFKYGKSINYTLSEMEAIE